MTELEFLEQTKTALERLNPKVLGSGSFVNEIKGGGCACCARGAFYIAGREKSAKLSSRDLMDKYYLNLGVHRDVGQPEDLEQRLDAVNENFHTGDNSRSICEKRWTKVYKWVGKQIALCKRAAA